MQRRAHGVLRMPHSQYWLPDDVSGIFVRNELWAVNVFSLLDSEEALHLIGLAEEHAAEHGWETTRHRFHPTTDIAVTPTNAIALHAALAPLIANTILPTMAWHYGFEMADLRMRDLFVAKYEAGISGVQDRLAAHRDGNLLSFSILLSDPAHFAGGGLRFHSLGPSCAACTAMRSVGTAVTEPAATLSTVCESVDQGLAMRAAAERCAMCQGVGRLPIPGVQRGDLTMHCGKLLHDAAPVVHGCRVVVVGFVIVSSPRIDASFVDTSPLANTSSVGSWADHEVLGAALLTPPGSPRQSESRSESQCVVGAAVADAGMAGPSWRQRERGGESDLASHLFGAP